MAVQIKKMLEASEQEIVRITRWMAAWWGDEEGYTHEAIRSYVAHGMQNTRLPQTYGLYLDGELIGMYQLRLDDLFVRPDLYPWLANVYLDEPYRKKGYGRLLLESVKENARANLPYDALYLYTTHVQLYEKYGWKFVGELDTCLKKARMQRLYRLDLG